ncbi:MAG: phosphatase PAP2 family protein [Patescibacteria group bacterium]|nr:phosphatase PAP2 family protein [Patescibacteria group bacterium]
MLAIVLTYALVASDSDWRYFEFTRAESFLAFGFPAALIGFFVPVLLPPGLYAFGALRKSFSLKNIGAALGQAAIIGWLISSLYKAFSGRLHPEITTSLSTLDISKIFNFGFLKNGIFFGWPSSHTAVAFAMAAAAIALLPRRREVALLALLYALYIGFGVSVSIHWLSDAVAGALIGTVAGLVVGRSYRGRQGAV